MVWCGVVLSIYVIVLSIYGIVLSIMALFYCIVLHCIALYCMSWYGVVLSIYVIVWSIYGIALSIYGFILLHCIVLILWFVLYCFVHQWNCIYCIVLCCIVLYRNVLYGIALYCIVLSRYGVVCSIYVIVLSIYGIVLSIYGTNAWERTSFLQKKHQSGHIGYNDLLHIYIYIQKYIKTTNRCALSQWSFCVLNEIRTCLIWGENNGNTEG